MDWGEKKPGLNKLWFSRLRCWIKEKCLESKRSEIFSIWDQRSELMVTVWPSIHPRVWEQGIWREKRGVAHSVASTPHLLGGRGKEKPRWNRIHGGGCGTERLGRAGGCGRCGGHSCWDTSHSVSLAQPGCRGVDGDMNELILPHLPLQLTSLTQVSPTERERQS